jgi:hypothetical protein
MTHPIIKTENYLLVVDESGIKAGDWCLDLGTNKMFKAGLSVGDEYKELFKKIIYHLPLNNALTLEGVPLLPPLEDDESICPYPEEKQNAVDWHNGYNKAKETHPNSDDDMIEFLDFYKSTNQEKSIYVARCLLNGKHIESKEILRIWKEQKPKLPTSFDTETKQ